MQVEAEPSAGVGVRMAAGARIGVGGEETVGAVRAEGTVRPVGAVRAAEAVPQREADPLVGVRPGGRGPGHEVHRVGAGLPGGVVPGQADRQSRAQESVGGDPRQVPAQQVGCQVAEIGAESGGEFAAVGAGHRP